MAVYRTHVFPRHADYQPDDGELVRGGAAADEHQMEVARAQ